MLASRIGFVALAAGGALALAGPARAQWSVTLMHPPESGRSEIRGVAGGRAVGYSSVAGVLHAALWTSGNTVTDLHPAGAWYSVVNASSATHQVGEAGLGIQRAFLWSGTPGSAVDLTPPGSGGAVANAIWGARQAGGVIDFHTRAGFWTGTADSFVDVHPAGATSSVIYGLDDVQMVGEARFPEGTQAILWTGPANTPASLHPEGALGSVAFGAHRGQQVGYAEIATATSARAHAALWAGTAASFVDLHPAGAEDSIARAVENGIQVGSVDYGDAYGDRAVVWRSTAGSMEDLSSLLGANYRTASATSIWSDATTTFVGGYAFNIERGRYEAVLWTHAVPTPGAAALLTLAGIFATRRRR